MYIYIYIYIYIRRPLFRGASGCGRRVLSPITGLQSTTALLMYKLVVLFIC